MRVRIEYKGRNSGRVWLDDVEVKNCKSASAHLSVSGLPIVRLEIIANRVDLDLMDALVVSTIEDKDDWSDAAAMAAMAANQE